MDYHFNNDGSSSECLHVAVCGDEDFAPKGESGVFCHDPNYYTHAGVQLGSL